MARRRAVPVVLLPLAVLLCCHGSQNVKEDKAAKAEAAKAAEGPARDGVDMGDDDPSSNYVSACGTVTQKEKCMPELYMWDDKEKANFHCKWRWSNSQRAMICAIDRKSPAGAGEPEDDPKPVVDADAPTPQELARQEWELQFSLTPRFLTKPLKKKTWPVPGGLDVAGKDKRYCNGISCTDMRYLRGDDGPDGAGSNRIPNVLSGSEDSREAGSSVAGTGAYELVDGWPHFGADAWDDVKLVESPVKSQEAQKEEKRRLEDAKLDALAAQEESAESKPKTSPEMVPQSESTSGPDKSSHSDRLAAIKARTDQKLQAIRARNEERMEKLRDRRKQEVEQRNE